MLYTIYDVETSGLNRGDDVLSFSYMLCDEHLKVKRAETLYFWKEGVTKWTEEAYKINNLSKDFLRQHADKYEENLKKMYIVLAYADSVGYNSGYVGAGGLINGFDYPMCKNFLERNNIEVPVPRSFIDVMKVYQSAHRGIRRKLQVVFDEYGLSRDLAEAMTSVYFKTESVAHNSAYDVVCTAILFSHLWKEGYITDETGDVNMLADIEQAEESQYILYFDQNYALRVRIEGEDVDMPLDLFVEKNPVIGAKITANPHAYLQTEV